MAGPLRSRIGLHVAQAGGALMILGGAADITIRQLLPNHREFLGFTTGPVPEATEVLVLALLHALGAALIAAGIGVLLLLREGAKSGRRDLALGAAGIALVAESMNAVGMYRSGSPLFIAPLTAMLLVLVGVALQASGEPSFARRFTRA